MKKNLYDHNSSTLHEGSILSANVVSRTSAHNTERSGNPQKNMTNKGDQKMIPGNVQKGTDQRPMDSRN